MTLPVSGMAWLEQGFGFGAGFESGSRICMDLHEFALLDPNLGSAVKSALLKHLKKCPF
jgi:hypothetical protein